MNIVKDEVDSSHYDIAEDPLLFVSAKTGRGPLTSDWVDRAMADKTPIMCAYKIIRAEFKYWGMQTRIEKYIQDSGKFCNAKDSFY